MSLKKDVKLVQNIAEVVRARHIAQVAMIQLYIKLIHLQVYAKGDVERHNMKDLK